MNKVISGSLILVMARIKQCGTMAQISFDHESASHWNRELLKASALKKRIEKRFNVRYNVLFVDFQSKKRVA